MHGGTDEAGATERREGAHAMSDGIATERNLGIALSVEETATRIANAVERRGGDIRGSDDEQGALCARDAGIDAPTATLRVGDAKLGDLRTKQGEDRMGVVAGVLVDRDDLEAEVQVPEMLSGSPDGDPDCLFVIPKRQDDGDVKPRALCHSP